MPPHDVKPGLHVEELPDQDRVPLLPSLYLFNFQWISADISALSLPISKELNLVLEDMFKTQNHGQSHGQNHGPDCCRSAQGSTSSYSCAQLTLLQGKDSEAGAWTLVLSWRTEASLSMSRNAAHCSLGQPAQLCPALPFKESS